MQVNNIYTVDASGTINMPYINKVRADGLTPAELANSIEGSYRAGQDLYKSYHHHRDGADRPVCERGWGRSRSVSRALH